MVKPIYKSRKFLILMVDVFAALLALYVGRLLPAESADLVLQTWAILQPAVLMVVGSIAYEDGKSLAAGTHPSQQGGA